MNSIENYGIFSGSYINIMRVENLRKEMENILRYNTRAYKYDKDRFTQAIRITE